MDDSERREVFVAWFGGPPMRGDRTALIRKTGYSKGRINHFLDPAQQFGERAARSLAERLGLPREFFNTPRATAPALPHEVSHRTDTVHPGRETTMQAMPPAEGYVRLPVLAEAAAGAGRDPEAVELIEHVDVAEEWVRRTLRANPSRLRVLTARGHSMTGQVEDGDAMFVEPTQEFGPDGLYIIAVAGLLRVKRLRVRVRVTDQVLSIESNDGSPPEMIPLVQVDDTLRICGRVIGAWSLRRL